METILAAGRLYRKWHKSPVWSRPLEKITRAPMRPLHVVLSSQFLHLAVLSVLANQRQDNRAPTWAITSFQERYVGVESMLMLFPSDNACSFPPCAECRNGFRRDRTASRNPRNLQIWGRHSTPLRGTQHVESYDHSTWQVGRTQLEELVRGLEPSLD